MIDDYSLIDIIKEYAIFSLAQSGKIQYPETLEERGRMLSKLNLDLAIKEFAKKDGLSDAQRKFLLK